MRWLPLALLLASTPVGASPITPVRLTGKLDGTTARISARYALTVEANAWEGPLTELELPRDGLVTGGSVSLAGVTHELGLFGADAASAKFQALAADPVKPGAKSTAVLIESGDGITRISVASARGGTLLVDLEIAVPTCYVREARYLAVPTTWKQIAGTTRPVTSDVELAAACGLPTDERVWTGFANKDVAKLPSGARVAVSGARTDLGDQTIARVEVTLANVLADIPGDLATALVIDNSRSLATDERTAQREIVAAYLKGAPASRVQVVAFARHAKPLLSQWTVAASGAPAIEQRLTRMVAENGSNVDAGLAEAGTWLRKIGGTRRVVLITDEHMAARLQATPAEVLQRLLPPGTLLHVVVPSAMPGLHERDDNGKLAPLAAITKGIRMLIGSAESTAALDVSRLLRPTSLDELALTAPGWSALAAHERGLTCESGGSLLQGGACTWWGQGARGSTPSITVEGKIWGTAFKRVVTPSRAHATDLVRELSLHPVLPSELRDVADAEARAVNAKWSLYAAWGGPGTYETRGGAGFSGEICSCDAPGGFGRGSHTGHGAPTPPAQVDLRTQLAAQLATCNLGNERVAVDVELTFAEIVDVHVRATQPRHAQCVAEVVWESAPQIAHLRPFQIMSFVAGG
ncbi:MAG: VWA domain-containing protein [Kofleriaceae bacterium]|nr:VWA domain-containing protein [Kofleriaceae bacterium]